MLSAELDTLFEAIAARPLFVGMADGTLPVRTLRYGLINFYPLIYNFPKYMAATLRRLPDQPSRDVEHARSWIIRNINIERLHAGWFRHWAVGFGADPGVFRKAIVPPPEMDAINHYLWHVSSEATFCEGVAAVNLAVEGLTGIWTKRVAKGIRKYARYPDVTLNKRTLMWLTAHASYDDGHPEEARAIVNAFATSAEARVKAIAAARRSLEYYAMAADACVEYGDREGRTVGARRRRR